MGSLVKSAWQGDPGDGFGEVALFRLAAGAGVRVVRRVVRLICAGWLPHDALSGWSVRGLGIERGHGGLLIAQPGSTGGLRGAGVVGM